MNIDTMRTGDVAIKIFETKAAELRKSQPHLTEAQAFAKVYQDPANRDIQRIERLANRPRLTKAAYPPVARTAPVVGATDGLAELKRLAAEFRRDNPFLTPEQAFARVYSDPANRRLAQLERSQNRPTA